MTYPQYTTVSLYRNNVGNTNYHGLTAKLEQRLSRGVSYSIAYTRSRLMDDASSVFDASVLTGPVASYPVADSFNRRLERDYSTGDIPHVLVAHTMWEIPRSGGIKVSALATLQSGAPLSVTQVTNFNAFAGFGTQRPNLAGDPTFPSSERTPARWFDTSAFSIAEPFTLGNSSRNPVRGPAIGMSISRSRAGHACSRMSLSSRGSVQPAEHARAGRTEYGRWNTGLRIDYVGGRSADSTSRAEIAFLEQVSRRKDATTQRLVS